jgi:hypothetical protein
MNFSTTFPKLPATVSRDQRRERRSVRDVLAPLDPLLGNSKNLFPSPLGAYEREGEIYHLPRLLFVGPGSGESYLRLGIFAGIHGDEDAGCHAVVQFLKELHTEPELARGYELFLYPVCNPTGYEDGTRWSRNGRDLNREFWQGSLEPEVRLLQTQLQTLKFDGLIALHADDTSEGLYGFVQGASLSQYVLEPALQAAETILPRNYDKSIDNFEANNGIITKGYPGVLSAPPEIHPRPFEIVFETPHLAPLGKQIEATVLALHATLREFRSLISVAQNI